MAFQVGFPGPFSKQGLQYFTPSSSKSICSTPTHILAADLVEPPKKQKRLKTSRLADNVPNQREIQHTIFVPLVTGSPACKVFKSPSPLPPSFKFIQKIAFPVTGLNVTPSSHGLSQSTHLHQSSSSSLFPFSPATGHLSLGKFVPPPVQFASIYTKNVLSIFPSRVGESKNQS